MSRNNFLSRRSVLRGMGAALALPYLDIMSPAATWAKTLGPQQQATPPLRMAFFFVPNGVNTQHWSPQREGYGYDLPSILQPLARIQDDICVLSGLTQDKGRNNGDGPGDHARAAGAFLTGCQPRKTAGGDLHLGKSVDQIAAQQIGQATRFPSLELGCDRSRDSGNCDSGYSCAYSHNISWSSPSTPVAKEIDPRQVFERLFGQLQTAAEDEAARERRARRRSILDYVQVEAQGLQRKLGQSDRRKLQHYLDSVRQIERRVENHERMQHQVELDPSLVPAGIPGDHAQHVRLMMDMMTLAFQTDQTRISTCMFAHAGSNRSYTEVDVPDGHHDLSHHGGDTGKLEKIRRINQYHMSHFAYFLDNLKAIPEGDGSLLDHCMIVYGSGLNDGNRHNNEDLPILLAGRGGGTIRSGRHIRYPVETPLNNLFLSMLDRMDVRLTSMGDATGRLDGLS